MTKTILVPAEPTIEMMQAGVNAWRAKASSQVYAEPLAEACYLAMLAAVPKPIPAGDREKVARAINEAKKSGDESDYILADAAISTLQGLGWGKK